MSPGGVCDGRQAQPPGQPPPGMEPGSGLAKRFEALARHLPQFVAGMRRLRASGVPLTISSDAGIGPHKPHAVLPWGPVLAVAGDPVTGATAVREIVVLFCAGRRIW